MGTTTAQLAGIQYRLPYTQKDFQSLMDAIRTKIPQNVPEWNDVQDSNYGMFILGTVAALCDWLAFYVDRSAAEAYVLTCIGKSSIANLLQLLNYQTRNAVAGYTMLRVRLQSALPNDVVIPVDSVFSDATGTNRFVTTLGATIPAGDLYVDIPARQGEWQTQNFTSNGSAQQRLTLSRTDIADGFIKVWVGQERWDAARDNTFAGTQDWEKLFRVIVNTINTPSPLDATPALAPELLATTIEFGDGFEGLIPPQGMPIRVDFLTTHGDEVRIPAGAVTQVVSTFTDVVGNPVNVTVVNTQSSAGGDAAESLYAARRNYPMRFRTMNRAVTPYDFTSYVESFPGVLIARVYDVDNNAESDTILTPDHPIPSAFSIPFYQARVYAVPRNDWTSESLNFALRKWLEERCPSDKQVVVLGPTIVGADIRVTVRVYSSFDANSVKYAVVDAIKRYFTISRDGDIQIGTTFHSSRLITILQQVPGVASLDFSAGLVGGTVADDLTPNFDQLIQINSLTVKTSPGL